MVELARRISGDWIELRGTLSDFHALIELLAITPADALQTVEKLRLSMEQGIVEYKRTSLARLLSVLETARYKTLTAEAITDEQRSLTMVLASTLVQRLIALELLARPKAREEAQDFAVHEMDIRKILSAVNERMKTAPDLRTHPAVKNIMVSVQRYNREKATLKQLLPTIKADKRASVVANFSKTSELIFAKIRRNFQEILRDEATEERSKAASFSLAAFPIKELAPLFLAQAEQLSRIRSTLAFARDERYRPREVLVGLYERGRDMLTLPERELAAYRKLCQDGGKPEPSGCVTGICNAFRDELIAVFSRQAR